MKTKQIYIVEGIEYSSFEEAAFAEQKNEREKLEKMDTDKELLYYQRFYEGQAKRISYPVFWRYVSRRTDSNDIVLVNDEAQLCSAALVLLKFVTNICAEYDGAPEVKKMAKLIIDIGDGKAAAGLLFATDSYEAAIHLETFAEIKHFQ